MKKLFLPLLAVLSLTAISQEAKAQAPFKSALGVVFDGNDGSNFGIQYKTALNGPQMAQFQLGFAKDWVNLGADWQYERPINGAEGLAWYVGVGAQLGFHTPNSKSATYFGLRPQIGLEYKIPTMPLGLHLDYKPYLGFTHHTGFHGDGFTFGIKYILK